MFLLGLVSFDRFFCPVTSFTPIRRPSRKNVASTFTFSLLPDRPPNVTGRGRRSQSRTHTRQTYKAIWRTKRTSCVYCFSHHTSRLNQIRFKGGGVVSVSSFLIVNTLPHCKDVVLDIYNTAEIVVSVTILKILVCFTHSSFVHFFFNDTATTEIYT